MKILIMVLSYMKPPYNELFRAQAETWDELKCHVDDVRTIYYHGGLEGGAISFSTRFTDPWLGYRERVMFNCTDDYYYMAAKFKMALEYVKDWDYDIIFRTNSSSYVNKARLKEFAENLPKEKLYAGWEITGNAGYNVVSGAGIFMSKDVAEILREKIDPNFEREEDVYCAQLLHDAGIEIVNDTSRYDVATIHPGIPLDRYHYRFKTGDRIRDANNMREIHKRIV